MQQPDTIIRALDATAAAYPERPAMRYKREGRWEATSWREYARLVRRVARGFMKLGLEPGKGVTIIGFNCPQWFLADLGAIAAGGVPAGIYTTSSPEQCQYITDHCDAQVVVAEDAAQLAKFLAVRDRLPKVKALVLMRGPATGEPDVYTWEQLLTLGDDVADSDLQARLDAQQPGDLCTLIYTSGTTGPPKAVMITHDNVLQTARAVLETVKVGPDDRMVSYLPLSHIAEQVVSLHGPMACGASTWFAESLELLVDALREARPTVFFAVPRVWEKMQAKMQAAGAQSSGFRKKLVAWARRQGLAGGYAEQAGRSKGLGYAIAQRLVFRKVRAALGLDQSRIQVSSAAPIARDTLEFFLSLGIPIYEVYGMSECTGPATLSLPGAYKTGSVGRPLPGTELKIAEDGEVLLRGFHVFKGYLKDEEATREAIDAEGWLHSGDVGEVDGDGYLRITDRKKELLITAGGENVAPQPIEGMLKSIPVVSQAVVVGDRRKYIAALVALDPERLPVETQAAGSPATSAAEAAQCPKFQAHLHQQIEAVNQRLARVQAVKRFAILPRELSIEEGELTPTMKTKRRVVNEHFAALIEGLYREG